MPSQSQAAMQPSLDSWMLQGAPQPVPSSMVSLPAQSQPLLRWPESWMLQGPLPSNVVLVPSQSQPEPDSFVLQQVSVPQPQAMWQPPLPPTPPASQQWVS